MERLPIEIASLICRFLPAADVPNARLTSKFLCDVATPFLLSEICLTSSRVSFDRLLEISRHPVIRQHITSLSYEPLSLPMYHLKRHWEDAVRAGNFHQCAQEQLELDEGWASYSTMYHTQGAPHDCSLRAGKIYMLMSNLPKLAAIRTSPGTGIVRREDRHQEAFASALHSFVHNPGDFEAVAIHHLRELLMEAHRANLSLEKIQLTDAHWRFLQAEDFDFHRMVEALKSVRHFDIHINTCIFHAPEGAENETMQCFEYLKTSRRLIRLIEGSQLLNTLIVACDIFVPICPAQLKYAVGNTKWAHLATVSFNNVDADEDSWVAFFCRHQETLRDVRFGSIRLLSGEWVSALQRMRQVLRLSSASVLGILWATGPRQYWVLGLHDPKTGVKIAPDEMKWQCNRTRKAVQDYLLGGGDCPLLDKVQHPQTY